MKKQLLFLSLATCGFTASVSAQQEKLLTHFIFDKMSINPAATGINDGICATTIYRNQWDKVSGAPNSILLNAEANIERWAPAGVGISIYGDAIGFARQTNVLLNYAHKFYLQDLGLLQIGISGGITNFGFNNAVWVTPSTPVNLDPSIPAGGAETALDLNAGVYFKSNYNWYAGISSTRLNEARFKTQFFNAKRHFFLMGGYKFMNLFGNDQNLDVQVLGRTDLNKYSADVNIRYLHKNLFYAGLTYRTSDAIALMGGINHTFGKINATLGYSYDLTVNKLSSISRGTHEIMLKGCYIFPTPPKQTSKHPRWL